MGPNKAQTNSKICCCKSSTNHGRLLPVVSSFSKECNLLIFFRRIGLRFAKSRVTIPSSLQAMQEAAFSFMESKPDKSPVSSLFLTPWWVYWVLLIKFSSLIQTHFFAFLKYLVIFCYSSKKIYRAWSYIITHRYFISGWWFFTKSWNIKTRIFLKTLLWFQMILYFFQLNFLRCPWPYIVFPRYC